MELLFVLLLSIALGFLGYHMADSRGRNKWQWATVCFIFGIFGVIVLALVGTKPRPSVGQ